MGRGYSTAWVTVVGFGLLGCGKSEVPDSASAGGGGGGSAGQGAIAAGAGGDAEPTSNGAPWANGERDACMALHQPFSTIAQPAAQSSQGCTQHGSDQCDCEGRSCPVGQSCLQVVELMTASEPAYSLNRCFSVCTTDAECGERQTCEVRRFGVKSCGAPFECHDDADCAREPGGVCAPVWGGQAHGGVRFQTGVQCAYPGSCDKTSCDGCYGEPTCHSCPWP